MSHSTLIGDSFIWLLREKFNKAVSFKGFLEIRLLREIWLNGVPPHVKESGLKASFFLLFPFLQLFWFILKLIRLPLTFFSSFQYSFENSQYYFWPSLNSPQFLHLLTSEANESASAYEGQGLCLDPLCLKLLFFLFFFNEEIGLLGAIWRMILIHFDFRKAFLFSLFWEAFSFCVFITGLKTQT